MTPVVLSLHTKILRYHHHHPIRSAADDIVKEVQSSLQALASLHGKLTELNARLPPEDRLPSPPMPRTRPHSDVALPVAGVPGSN